MGGTVTFEHQGTTWAQVSPPGQRMGLAALVDSTIEIFREAGLNTADLQQLVSWVNQEGNPQVGSNIGTLTAPQRDLYVEIARTVTQEMCVPSANPENRPMRPGLGRILERSIAAFRENNWSTQTLSRIQTWLSRTGNPRVSSHIRQLTEEVRGQYLQNVALETFDYCGFRPVPAITRVQVTRGGTTTASSIELNPGDEVAVIITGTNLPADPAVSFILNGEADPSIILVGEAIVNDARTEATLTIRVPAEPASGEARGLRLASREYDLLSASRDGIFTISLPAEEEAVPDTPALPATCTDGLDNDLDGLIDTADPDCQGTNPAGETALTGANLASYYLFNVLGAQTVLSAGFSARDGEMPADLAAPAMSTPNLGLRLTMGNLEHNRPVTLYGRHNPLIGGSADSTIEWQGAFRLSYLGSYQDGGYNDFSTALGQQARFHPQGNVYIDAFGNIGFAGFSRDYPTRRYFDGRQLDLSAGLGFGTDWGQPAWVDSRIFGEYRRSWTSYNEGAFASGPFDGGSDAVRLGLRLDLNLSRISETDSEWIPDVWLYAQGQPWGRMAVPEFIPGLLDSRSLEDVWSVGGELGVVWRNQPAAPFLTFGLERTAQGASSENEHWTPQWRVFGSVGVDTTAAGVFTLGAGYTDNVLLYGPAIEQLGPISLMWTMPWLNRSLSIRGEYSNFLVDENNTYSSGGASILWDPLRTFLPTPPQPVQNDHSRF